MSGALRQLAEGEDEGKGGNSVSPGLVEMMLRMETGRLKIFSNLEDFFKEKRIYHTVDGKIIRKGEDLMSATRYVVMSIRHARAKIRMFARPVRVDSSFDALQALLN